MVHFPCIQFHVRCVRKIFFLQNIFRIIPFYPVHFVRRATGYCRSIEYLSHHIGINGKNDRWPGDKLPQSSDLLLFNLLFTRDKTARQRFSTWWLTSNIRMTGPIWWESTGHRWITITKARMRGFGVVFFFVFSFECWTHSQVTRDFRGRGG